MVKKTHQEETQENKNGKTQVKIRKKEKEKRGKEFTCPVAPMAAEMTSNSGGGKGLLFENVKVLCLLLDID